MNVYKEIICPQQPCCLAYFEEYLYAGTYELNQAKTLRTGAIFKYSPDLTLELEKPLNAILDLKLYKNVLYAAASDGLIYGLNSNLEIIWQTTVDSAIVTFIYPSSEKLAFTLDNGVVGVLGISSKSILYSSKSHSEQAWTCHLSENILLTGGDDCCLIKHQDGNVVYKNKSTHGAGVTSILPFNNVLLTGSYDDILREWVDGKVNRTLKLPGGVWRLCRLQGNVLLVCCMQGGAVVVDVSRFEIIAAHDAGNLVYGCAANDKQYATASFYDKRIIVYNTAGE